jgi:DNA polymerase-4
MASAARPLAAAQARAILHVDLDCFFVSVERVLNPSLAQRPVIVGGPAESRGVVCSASREARSSGVHSGMATAVARRLCPDAVFLPGRGRLYARAAAAAQKVLREFSPRVERASIDEAYLDVTDCDVAPMTTAALIQRALQARLGLPSSIGIGANKMVAKVACQLAKPEGIIEVWPGYEQAYLSPLSVSELPGVGPALAERLALFGLRTIGEVARVDEKLLQATFGATGRHLGAASRGRGDAAIAEEERPRSISQEHTFPRDVRDLARLEEEVRELAAAVAERLHAEGLRGRTVTLKLRTADFRTLTRSRTIADPTDDPADIARLALLLLRPALGGNAMRLVGVAVGQLTDAPAQAPLFQQEEAAPTGSALTPPAHIDDARRRRGFLVRWHPAGGEPGT